jgi:predicted benzoate:H+ symporter BenE
MKTINLSVCIIFGLLSLLALIIAIVTLTLSYGFISGILLSVSYVAFKDYKDCGKL